MARKGDEMTKMASRGWALTDLSGREREIADAMLGQYFAGEPGMDETLRRFDEAVCAKYGFKRTIS